MKDKGVLMLDILSWVLAEQLDGRRPNDHDVAKQFSLTLQETMDIHDELEAMGEFD